MADYSSFFYSISGSGHLFERISPTSDQREYLQVQHNALGEILKTRLTVASALSTETWIQGSYKYGTLLRPFEGEEFDLDLGFYFVWSGQARVDVSPVSLRSAVQAELELHASREAEILSVDRPPKMRCCRVSYKQQFHIDVPVYHLDRPLDYRELATGKNEWEHSDPKLLYKWLRDRILPQDYFQLRRIICYLKAWSRLTVAPAARPASILLTVLAVEAYFALARELPTRDDAALVSVVQRIAFRLRRSSVVRNPANNSENINRLGTEGLVAFLRNLDDFAIIGNSALSAPTQFSAGTQWSRIFRYMMPLPAATDDLLLREAASASRGSLVVQPTVDITIRDQRGRPYGPFRDRLPGFVPKYSTIRFRVANDREFPADATYTWTVRNQDAEAADVNDLGHDRAAIGAIVNEESTLYNGTHYMDLKVSAHDGRPIAFRRIPVEVRGTPLQKRYIR